MTKASRDTQGGRKAKRGKKERKTDRQTDRKKERGRERERREKEKVGVPSYEQSSRDTPKKEREILSIPFRKAPESKERKGKGRGRRGD